jgi:hypothetical protein
MPVANTIAAGDRIVILTDVTTTPRNRTISLTNLSKSILLSNSAPANSTSNGTTGQVAYDSNYLYICTSNNVWGRIELDNSW